MADQAALMPLVKRYFELDAQSAARALEMLPEDQALQVLKALPSAYVVKAIRHLQVSYAAALLRDADAALFSNVVSALEPQFAATIFMHLPGDARERLLQHVPEKMRGMIRELLTYPDDSVGRIMSTDFLSFHKEIRVQSAIEKIRALALKRFPSSYLYVIDDDEHLIGVMNMRDMLLASPHQTLESIMRRDVFSLHCFVDREEAANQLSRRRYFAAPVVDSQNRILGIIKAEQLLHGIQEEVTEDLQRMFGAGADERTCSPLLFSMRKRLPWLHINLVTAFMAAATVSLFEDLIAKLTILAVFLPVVAGQGGNAGAQSLAVVMRGLVMREIPANGMWRLIFKEGILGAVNGAIIGVVTALIAWVWNGNPWLGLVIGLGMLVNLILAGFSGAAIPIVMKKIGLDPAQCSSIILTTITDVMGFMAFLGFALLFQSYLV
jgi:magnesium transporter